MKPIWPKIPAPFVRTMLASHSALGLFIAALVYLICLTGVLAVFTDELHRWESPRTPEMSALASAALQRAAEAALAAAPGPVESMTIFLPTQSLPRAGVSLSTAAGARDWAIAADGALAPTQAAPWADFVAALHMYLNAPGLIGYFVVGLAGVAMLALAISGLMAHPRVFRDAFTLRWGGSRRLQEADLHNRLSVWSLPFNLAVSLTGAYFGLISLLIYLVAVIGFHGDTEPLFAAMAPPPAAESRAPAPLPALGDVIARVRADGLHAAPFSITIDHPLTRGQSLSIYAETPRHLRYGEQYYVTPAGDLRHVGFADGDLGQRLYGAAYPLHFGWFGGIWIKLLYGALGLALCVIIASGVNVWLARRRDQNRPAPIAGRLWDVVIWGVPIALAGAAGASLALSWPPLAVFWAVFAACALASAAPIGAGVWRTVCAVSLAGLVLIHALLAGAALFSVAGAADAALLGAALIVLWPLRPRAPRLAPA
jgi:uncharacterized iron-regulated membrane protein